MTSRRRWFLILACGSALITLTMGLRQTFGLFLPPISEALGTGREMFAFAIAVQNLIWGASSPFFGALADRFGARWVAAATNPRHVKGTLGAALERADVFIGLSVPGILTVRDLKRMARDPIVFAMANPEPEIRPEEAEKHLRLFRERKSAEQNEALP